MTDFSEDVVPVSDISLAQNMSEIALISPVSFCVPFFPPWFYRAEMNCRKLLNSAKKEINWIGIFER